MGGKRERERKREIYRHIPTPIPTACGSKQRRTDRFASHLGKPEHLVKGDEAVTVSHQTAKETVTGQVVGTQIELELCVCVWSTVIGLVCVLPYNVCVHIHIERGVCMHVV